MPPDPYLVEWERLRRMVRASQRIHWIMPLAVLLFACLSWHPVALGAGLLVAVIAKFAFLSRFQCPHCNCPYMTFWTWAAHVRGEREQPRVRKL